MSALCRTFGLTSKAAIWRENRRNKGEKLADSNPERSGAIAAIYLYLLREVFSVSHFDKFIVVFFKFIKPNLKIPRC